MKIRATHLNLLTGRSDCVRYLHDLDVDVEANLGHSLMQRQNAVNAFDRSEQR